MTQPVVRLIILRCSRRYVFRGFSTRNVTLICRAYITYNVLSLSMLPMYGTLICYLHINALERVQRYFTRRIPVLRNLSYEEIRDRVDVDTLNVGVLRQTLHCTIKSCLAHRSLLQHVCSLPPNSSN